MSLALGMGLGMGQNVAASGGGGGAAGTTLDPVTSSANMVLSNGNLTATRNTTTNGTTMRAASTTAKVDRYFEATFTFANFNGAIAIWDASTGGTSGVFGTNDSSIVYNSDGTVKTSGATAITGTSYSAAGTHTVACAIRSGKVYFALWNGSSMAWQGSDPVAQTGGIAINTTFFPLASVHAAASLDWGADAVTLNFGASAFLSSPPTGTVAWNS